MVDFLLCLAFSRAAPTSRTRLVTAPSLMIFVISLNGHIVLRHGSITVCIRCLWLLTFCLAILDLKG